MKAILLLVFSLTAYTFQAQQISPVTPMVMVEGEAIVKVVPDGVVIKSRIEHEGQDPQEVKSQNDAVVANILNYLKQQGIPSKNVQTEYVNLNKNYNYDNKTYSYVANQAISIKLDNLKNYEKILSGLLEAGLNRIDGIEFKSSKIEEFKVEARKKAVVNAKQKAQEYASTLGQEIGKAVVITEVNSSNFLPVMKLSGMRMSEDAAVEESLAPGEMEILAKISVGFELL